MKKTKYFFTLTLRLFLNKEINIDEAVDNLWWAYVNGKGFNRHNFIVGFVIGSIAAFAVMSFII